MPKPANGLAVNAFATGLDHPRWLYVLPNGDVLVAETNTPKQEEGRLAGIKGMVDGLGHEARRRRRAEPEPHHAAARRRRRRRGRDQERVPRGAELALRHGADRRQALCRRYRRAAPLRLPGGRDRDRDAADQDRRSAGGPLNYHWTKSLAAAPDGSRLYVGVGSNSNAGENGLAWEKDRAQILEIDPATGEARRFATGLRNPVGLAFEPQTGVLWAVVNERDELGSDLVPDYLTSVKDGAFYGWPFSYWGQHVDERVKPQNPEAVAKAIAPDYSLGNHVAPLGLAFAQGDLLPEQFRTARLSASTAHGTASRSAATRWCSCRSRKASRQACRSTC